MRKIWIGLALLAAIVLGGTLWWTMGKEEQPARVRTFVVNPGTLDQEIFTTGRVVPRKRQELRPLIAGKIDKIYVKEGDQVQVGQVLMQMDTALADVQVEQAEAGVEAARANLRLAEENLETALATPEIMAPQAGVGITDPNGNQLSRDNNLIQDNDLPQDKNLAENESNLEVFRPQNRLPTINVPMSGRLSRSAGTSLTRGVSDSATPAVTQAEMRVSQAKAGLKQAEAALKGAKAQREQHILKAVIKGTVTEVNANKGSLASMQTPLAVISNLNELKVEAELNEIDGGKVMPNQQVTISSAILGASVLKGVVEKVGLEALSKSSLQAPGSTVVKVEISLDKLPPVLKPGFTVDVKIVLASKQGVLAVPYESLFQEGNKTFVYIVKQGKLVQIEVIPGAANDIKQEILSGLEEGDQVVLNPSASYFEGMDVEAID